jgi:hypothetical protein
MDCGVAFNIKNPAALNAEPGDWWVSRWPYLAVFRNSKASAPAILDQIGAKAKYKSKPTIHPAD